MQIIVMDRLLQQTKSKRISRDVVSKIYEEIGLLQSLCKLGRNSLSDYLRSQNGKKMKGNKNVFKYRLSDGDRILYTYSKYLDYVSEEDAIVVLGYAKHDKQGDEQLPGRQTYYVGNGIVEAFDDQEINEQDLIDMSLDDENVFDDIFSRMHAHYILDKVEGFEHDPDFYDVVLSFEQIRYIDEYMDQTKPFMIIGGAGTGKTIMAIHILAEYRLVHEWAPCAFFTQSRELRQKIERQYRYISGRNGMEEKDDHTYFFNLNDLCIKELGLQEKHFVCAEQFCKFIEQSPEIISELKKKKIAIMDLWAEIRGTIKGSLDQQWRRVNPKNRLSYGREIIDELNRAGLLEWQENRQLFFVSDFNYHGTELSAKARETYEELCEYFTSVDPEIKMIDKAQYLNLQAELSTLSLSHREFAYRVCEKYQKWLGEERYDENDLALMMLKRISDFEKKYEMLIVDEIQDYSELQIYLMHCMVEQDCHFIMAGDVYQNINFTSFRDRRLYSLVGRDMIRRTLSYNFRCQQKILNCVNGLNAMRYEFIGVGKAREKELSDKDGISPFMLSCKAENEKKMIASLLEYPGAVLLVADMDDKMRLGNIVKSISGEAQDIVFTVAEIKGMEYKYVVCYNLIGCFEEEWKQIIVQKKAAHESRYQYYFNLLYVGFTRAQEVLCIMEPKGRSLFYAQLEEKTGQKLQVIDEFDEVKLHISTLSNSSEDWLSQGRQYEENGLYEQALQMYHKGDAEKEVLYSCQMKLYAQKREYEKALTLAFIMNDIDSANRMLPEIEDNKELCRLLKVWLEPEEFRKENSYHASSVSELIATCIEEEYRKEVELQFIRCLDERLKNYSLGNRRYVNGTT